MDETLGNLSLSDLIRLACPVTGTASFQLSSSSRPPKRIKLEKALLSNPNPSRKTFTPISIPVLLVGTVHFVSEDHTSSCLNHCLSFSDSSSTVCCYILDFDPGILGREIHVMAWNYLPIKQGHGQGVLEIIQWRFPSPGTAPCYDNFLSVESSQDSGVKARSSAFGVVRSVSLTFSLPFEHGKTGEMGDSVGFLAEILTCSCDSCARMHGFSVNSGLHRFTESKVVYFINPTHKWRPVFAKLVGKVMYLSGLKKRLVVVGTESHVLLVSTIKTKVSICAFNAGDLLTDQCLRRVYRGFVTGIHLHGAVIELDKKIWLLIHDALLVPHHSLRIGALVSVRDFHVVHANFAWTKVIILGTCVRTSLEIDSFAITDTRVFVKTEEKSVLGNFVESLELSAKFWALLMVSCFKCKFRTVLSDKELLGSNNSAGLVQTYSTRSLPPDVFLSHSSIFSSFCNHDRCTYSTGHQTNCKLVVPLSNFVGKCEELWISIQSEVIVDSELCCDNMCDGMSYPSFVRRIIPSDDFGCILIGRIQICPSSGRLQMVDATGNIDVVIPDLPSNVKVQAIYEVSDYRVILEGFRTEGNTSLYNFGEPLSCSAVFNRHAYRKRIHGLVFYVQFYLKNSVCLTSPSHVPSNLLDRVNHAAHLLVISHKYPLTNKISISPIMRQCSNLFAEALVFPCTFKLSDNGELIQDEKTFQDVIDLKGVSRRHLNKASEKGPCLSPCSASSRNRGVSVITSRKFDGDNLDSLVDADLLTRILLEFKCEDFFKYQLLRIGSYHLLNCSEGFGPTRMCKCIGKGGSLIVTEDTFCSIYLASSDDINEREPCGTSLEELVLLSSVTELHDIMDLKSMSHGITKLLPPNQVLSVSSCVQLMSNQSRIFCGSTDQEGQRLVQGDLISVCGYIDAFHVCDYDPGFLVSANYPGNSNQSENYICIHLTDGCQTVVIRGSLSRKLHPVGIGTGASATFYRILLTCSSDRKEKLLLTPTTYIEITSVREVIMNRELKQKMFRIDSFIESSCSIPVLRLFSDLDNADLNVSQFHCRVLTLNVLILESCTIGSVLAYTIPLAGFVLDDGSAICNCWIRDDHQTSTVLHLPDICSSFFSSDFSCIERASRRSLAGGLDYNSVHNKNGKKTVGYFLVHMLKKHHKVTVKNHGISLDISCQDLSFHSGSGKIFSILEKRLLNHIILTSCEGPTFSVNGVVMDENATKEFDTYISESETLRGSAPNIWIKEVAHIDPLKSARNMLHDIKIR